MYIYLKKIVISEKNLSKHNISVFNVILSASFIVQRLHRVYKF